MTQGEPSSSSSSEAEYTGPSVKDMLRTHTLAANIIARHVDSHSILDGSELVLLRRFVNAPDSAAEILADCNMAPKLDGKENQPQHGSLVGFVINLYAEAKQGDGNGREPPLDDEEIALLRKWFARGQPEARMVGCVETGKT